MGFLNSLLGGENIAISVFLALVAVLVLIVLAVWVLKFVLNATGNAARGRARRLGVVEASPVDQKHQLVLIRRDDVEHLLLVGGESSLVIETGIPAAPAGRPMSAQVATPAAKPAPTRKTAFTFTPQRRNAAEPVDTSPPPTFVAPAHEPVAIAEPPTSSTPEPAISAAPPARERDTTFDDLAKKAAALPFPNTGSGSEPINPIERLRALAQQSAKPRPVSLRHTGLLRPQDETSPDGDPSDAIAAIKASVESPENPAPAAADSATNATQNDAPPTRPDQDGPVANDGTENGTQAAGSGEREQPRA